MLNREELMTVGQLVEYLQQYDLNRIVGFEQPTNDYHGTIAVVSPYTVDKKQVKFREYHESMVPFRYLLKRINETHNKGLELK